MPCHMQDATDFRGNAMSAQTSTATSATAANNTASQRMPVLFVSHGAPDVLLGNGPTAQLWQQLGQTFGKTLPRPKAILVLSAHWTTGTPAVSLSPAPRTIHDFAGFSSQLYQMNYPAPGAPELAQRAQGLLQAAGVAVSTASDRGLDHGAWIPLLALFPEADIPVTQLSILPEADPAAHWQLGQLLSPLRDEGVLILASGCITHNFGWLSRPGSPAFAPAVTFADWIGDKLDAGEREALLDYRAQAPYGAASHPTDEHLLPLFVALGAAAATERPQRFVPEFAYGGLAMDAYLWGGTTVQH